MKSLKRSAHKTHGFTRFKVTTLLVAAAVLAIEAVTVVSKQRQASTTVPNRLEKRSELVSNVAQDGQAGQMAELTPLEAQKIADGLKKMVNQSTEGLVEVRHPNGSVSVDLKGRFQNVTVARVNKDGSVSQSCLDNPRAAAKFFGLDPRLMGLSTTSQVRNGGSPARVKRQK